MRRVMPEIHEPLDTLEERLAKTKDAKRKRRVHLLVLICSGQVRSRGAAAKHLGVHRNTVGEWLSAYENGGLDALLDIRAPGAKPGQKVLTPAVLKALKEQLQDEGFCSYKQVRQWLEQEFGLDIPYTTVYGLVRFRLGSKLKRARPQHVKKTSSLPPASSAG
jgi:transposase